MTAMNLQQNTQEWLDFRENHLGASDACIIMGVSPWKTPYELWLEKIGSANVKKVSGKHIDRGNNLEPFALSQYNQMNESNCIPVVLVSKSVKFMSASLDGYDAKLKKAVEIKCPGKEDHELAKKGGIPSKYYPQLQHQLYVANLESIDYFSFDGINGITIKVFRDNEYIKQMISEESKFWTHVSNLTPPAFTNRDFREGSKEWVETAEKLYALQQEESKLKVAKEELSSKLKELSDGSSTTSNGYKFTKYEIKGRVNYASIPELKKIDLEKYRGDNSVAWRFSFENK